VTPVWPGRQRAVEADRHGEPGCPIGTSLVRVARQRWRLIRPAASGYPGALARITKAAFASGCETRMGNSRPLQLGLPLQGADRDGKTPEQL
jgi:hypothetical protein